VPPRLSRWLLAPSQTPSFSPQARRALILGTGAFVLSFAVWGLISALAPFFKTLYHLSYTQVSLLIAIPVLLGAVMRLPMGTLADRFGGRLVFSILLFFIVAPCVAIGFTHSYGSLLFWAFWLGMAGTSFSVGVAFVSRWVRPEVQVTGLVGAAGGLGGFFPPLVLGYVKQRTDSYALGFVFLSAYALICRVLNLLVFLRRQPAEADAAA